MAVTSWRAAYSLRVRFAVDKLVTSKVIAEMRSSVRSALAAAKIDKTAVARVNFIVLEKLF